MYLTDSNLSANLNKVVNIFVRGWFGQRPISVYEAGGGSSTIFDFRELKAKSITVVDISPEQISNLAYATEGIVGNIETFVRPAGCDFIVCFNVLEHVDNPHLAIDSMVASLAPGGLLVIGGPNPNSLQGLVTRFTPHWFHVLVCKAMGFANAGEPGHAPFPTTFAAGSFPTAMRRRFVEKGLDIELMAFHREGHLSILHRRFRPAYWLLVAALVSIRTVTLGLYDPSRANFFVVASKRA